MREWTQGNSGMIVMQALIECIDGTQSAARDLCLSGRFWPGGVLAGADLLIFLGFAAIFLALHRVVRARRDPQIRGFARLILAFIALCGLAQLLAVVAPFVPVAGVQAAVTLGTALVSVATVILLVPLVPRPIALPSRNALRAANARLIRERDAHAATLRQLRQARDVLEDQVAERTHALERTNAELNIVLRQAANRGRNLKRLTETLARQTAKETETAAEFIHRFQARISAMVEASDALTLGEGRLPGTMKDVVERQLCAYIAAYQGRIRLDGADQPLAPVAARQIGVALNELVTNAIKHGALRDATGRVDISWGRYRGFYGGENRFQMHWREILPTGHAAIRDPRDLPGESPVGHGSRVLNISVPQRLNGRAEVDYLPDGLSYALDLPMECLSCDAAETCGKSDVPAVPCPGRAASGRAPSRLPSPAPEATLVEPERRSA